MNKHLIEITAEQADAIIRDCKPLGLFFLYDKDAEGIVAIDNSTGQAWTEEFDTPAECQEWLNNNNFTAEEVREMEIQLQLDV